MNAVIPFFLFMYFVAKMQPIFFLITQKYIVSIPQAICLRTKYGGER